MSRIKIYLTGAFKIEGESGVDLTPTGSKECALIALLVRSRAGEWTRGWLQAKLWSDRGKEQAAASLRQAVMKIRKSLGDEHHIIYSSRRIVGIKLSEVDLIEEPGLEFLEGLDVRDEEFEYWLAAERSSLDNAQSPVGAGAGFSDAAAGWSAQGLSPPTCLLISAAEDRTATGRWLERLAADMVKRTLGETFSLPIVEQAVDQLGGNIWRLKIDSFSPGQSRLVLRIALIECRFQRELWSTNRVINEIESDLSESADLISLTNEVQNVLTEKIGFDSGQVEFCQDPNALCSIAIKKIFSMRADEVAEADALLARAFELHPRGLYVAWRAQVREVQFIERLRGDAEALREECEALARQAIELEPSNSTVLAIVAITRLHFGHDIAGALDFSLRSVRANRANPMAWWAFGAAQVAAEHPMWAYCCAKMAADLAEGTPLEFLTKSQLSGAAIAMRKLDDAKALLKTVSFFRPEFRPPLRYLLALHATDKEWGEALETARKLAELEPGFSIERLANDKDYPALLLHKPYGLDRSRILSLV